MPRSSTTGRWRKWLTTMIERASMAFSVGATQVGFAVMIIDI